MHWFRRDAAAQRERGAETIALSEAQGFPMHLGLGRAWQGHARVFLGDGAAALAEILEGMTLAAGTGQRAGATGCFLCLAEAQRALGEHGAALAAVETAFAVSAAIGERIWSAELHRLKGELLLASRTASPSDAEALFQHALAIAREQQARLLELRAATSLARLWRDRGDVAQAGAILAPVYGWFTEGLDTRDLIEANALLTELR